MSFSPVFIAGTSIPVLSNNIASKLGSRPIPVEIGKFSDGEIRVELGEHLRGQTVFIVQSTCAPTNDNIMELLITTDAVRRSAAKRIVAVVPYYGYARQDRRPGYSRTPITSRLVADMFQMSGIDQVVVVDIHSGQQVGFFTVPVVNVSATPLFVADIWAKYGSTEDLTIVSPDVGGVVRARSVAKQLDNVDLAIVDKRREQANQCEVMHIIGNVKNKMCVIIDDMIDTAGTLCKAAAALKHHGAKSVVAYASHPVFSGNAYENIANSVIDEIVVTDTIPLKPNAPSQIRTISVAGILAETIRRIRGKESISQIYTGA